MRKWQRRQLQKQEARKYGGRFFSMPLHFEFTQPFFFSPHGEKRGIVMGEEEEERWSAIANHTGTWTLPLTCEQAMLPFQTFFFFFESAEVDKL